MALDRWQKSAATKAGVTYDEYERLTRAGKLHCTGCGAWKSRGHFPRSTTTKRGRGYYCRLCWAKVNQTRKVMSILSGRCPTCKQHLPEARA